MRYQLNLGAGLALLLLGTAGAVKADVITYTFETLTDGRNLLHLDRNRVYWYHIDFAAPGRISGNNFPTYITTTLNGYTVLDRYPWVPDWPTPPPDEIRYATFSSTFTGLYPTIPLEYESLLFEPLRTRYYVQVVGGYFSNGFGYLDFNDNPPPGADWYVIRLTFTTKSLPEPGTVTLFGLMLGGGAVALRRRWKGRS